MTEVEIWKKIKFTWARRADCVRIENVASFGLADINCCVNGLEFWLELKVIRSGKSKIQSSQIAWIAKRLSHGGRVYIYAVDNATLNGYLYDAKSLYKADVLFNLKGQAIITYKNLVPICTIRHSSEGLHTILNIIITN